MTPIEKYKLSEEISIILKVIANPVRLLILCILLKESLNVSEIVEKIEISQSAVSQHLAILRKNNIIDCSKNGKYVQYHIKNNKVRTILGFLQNICVCD